MPELPTPAVSADPDTAGPALATPAWVMTGWGRHVAGVLVAGRGRLAFVADDGPLFDVPVAAVTDVVWPWHWFGGGVMLRAAGTAYTVAFILPNGAAQPSPSLLAAGFSLLSCTAGVVPSQSTAAALDVHRGRAAARRWKEVLPGA